MPDYTFICPEDETVFTVYRRMTEFTGEEPCPVCEKPTKHRVYEPTVVTIKVGRHELPNAGRGREFLKDRD